MTDEEKRSAAEEEKSEAQQLETLSSPDSPGAKSQSPVQVEREVEKPAESSDLASHGDHFAHPLSMPLLGGVLGALILLTVLTVGVTAIDLGSQGNFIVAMIIATVKAVLVMGFFMHMFWDSKFNVVAFTSSFLFVLLFLAMSTLDRAEYREKIDTYEADQKIQAQN